ncbi:AMP-binding enzyme family protein [Burkholderia pseudomallei]|nr:AMP-binding protein [Burkholderia pseudomallei]KGD55089.1 AMP-binding enzyme family protein [Burkholderia pseudomallei]
MLSCYTTNLIAYLGRADPSIERQFAVSLSVRVDLDGGRLAFLQHGSVGPRLGYRAATTWGDARRGLEAELDRYGGALAVASTRNLPWSPAHGIEDTPHWIQVQGRESGRWRMVDAFDALLPHGEQRPFDAWVDDDTLHALLAPLPALPDHVQARDAHAFGAVDQVPPASQFRWLSHDADTRIARAGEWIDGTDATLHYLSRRFVGEIDTLRCHAEDLWAASRHHQYRFSHQPAVSAAWGRARPLAALRDPVGGARQAAPVANRARVRAYPSCHLRYPGTDVMNDSRALYDWFAVSVEHHGSLPALEIEERQWTYTALAARARVIAAAIVDAHADQAPARVGLLAARTPDAYAGYLSIQQLGAVAVPLNPAFPHARLATICARAQIDCVLTDLAEFDDLGAPLVRTPDDAAPCDYVALPGRDDLAYILFTSGSTGAPKGVPPVQLLRAERDRVAAVQPDEAVGFESLEQQPEAVAAPAENLDAITTSIAEHKQRRDHEVQVHRLFDQDRQSVDAHAEVDRIAMQVDLQPFVEPEQGGLPSIWITVASSLTLASPRSNSTPFDRRTCNESAINDVSGGSTGETAGTVRWRGDDRANACVSLIGTRRAGPGMSIDTPSITSGPGLIGVCSVCY